MSINTRSRELSVALAKVLGSQEGMSAAMLLQSDDAFTLPDIPNRMSNPQGIDKAQRIVDMFDLVRQFGIKQPG